MRVLRVVVTCIMVMLLLSSGVFANKNYADKIEALLMTDDRIESVQVVIDGEDITIIIAVDEMDIGLLELIQGYMADIYKIYPFDSLKFEIYIDGMPVLSFTTTGDHVSDYIEGKLALDEWADQIEIMDLIEQQPLTKDEFVELVQVIEEPVEEEEVVEEKVEEAVEEEPVTEETTAEEAVDEEVAEEEAVVDAEPPIEEEQGLSAIVYALIAAGVAVVGGLGWFLYKKRAQ